jgi:hypothetical protein
MRYTKRKFGAELILELEKDVDLGFDITRMSKWADKIHNDHIGETDDDLDIIIQNIGSMSFGSEFELTKEELLKIAIDCIIDSNSK